MDCIIQTFTIDRFKMYAEYDIKLSVLKIWKSLPFPFFMLKKNGRISNDASDVIVKEITLLKI